MAFTYNLEKDLRYQQGMKKGKMEGIREGIREGMEKGMEDALAEKVLAIQNMTEKYFQPDMIAGILETDEQFILLVQQQLHKKPQIEALLAEGTLNLTEIAARLEVEKYVVKAVEKKMAKRRI